jgi:hypothetical protein
MQENMNLEATKKVLESLSAKLNIPEVIESLRSSSLRTLSVSGSKELRFDDKQLSSVIDCIVHDEIKLENVSLKHHRLTSCRDIGTSLLLWTDALYNKADVNTRAKGGLKVLDLENNDIDGDGADEIISALATENSVLESLDLSYNPISSDAGLAIADALKTNSSLKHLNLSHCDLSLSACIAIQTVLRSKNTTLETLSLDRPILSTEEEEGNDHFGRMIAVHPKISAISLRYNKVGDLGAQLLSEALDTNRSLMHINLECNEINVAGAEYIASSLIEYKQIKSLRLSYNNIGDEGAMGMAQALEKNTSLEILTLKENKICTEGLIALASALPKNNSLKVLNLFGNKFDNASCEPFGVLIRERFPYVGLDVDFDVYVVDGVHCVAEQSCETY